MSFARIFRACAGLIGLAALGVQYALMLQGMGGDVAAALLRFLTYFTLLGNMVGAGAFLFPAFAPKSLPGRFFEKPSVRTAAALYLLVIGVVYHVILASRWNPQGWQLAADIVLHTVAPLAMLADWALLTPKRDVKFSMLPRALLIPLAFGVWVLALGAANGFYPYPFLDVTALGYLKVVANLAILLAVFAASGALMIIAGGRLPAAMRRKAAIDAGPDLA